MMAQDPTAQFTESERTEFERVVDELAKWPRLSHLLRYMGDKLFAGEVDQLNEYNIATEVLGRSKTVFNAGEDAIARVETHRLRKRLVAFYEEEGKDHPIQLTLPAGSYVPVFVHKHAQTLSSASSDTQTHGSESRNNIRRLRFWIVRRWKHVVIAVSLVLVALAAYLYHRAGTSSTPAKSATSALVSSATIPVQSAPPSIPVRLLAGYSGPPRTDSAGRVWNPDQYFTGGGSWQRTPGFIARTSDPFLFEHSRTGDFSYSIPLKPGSYELHLFFSTPIRANESISTFNVWVNGDSILQGFDINVDALGEDIANERIFRDVSPDKEGFLRISFSSAIGPPTLNAIEILPGVPHAQLPIRLVMQTTPLTDRMGQFWYPDNYFMHGRLSNQMHPLVDSPDPDLFSQERYGHFTYAIPVDMRGRYTLVLHFAEFYFNSAASGTSGRVFKVMCNGQTLLDNFDIFREAGRLHEVTKTFRHLKPSAQGKLNLTFEPIVNNATVSGIEVLDESQ
jgi:hypothetical protein